MFALPLELQMMTLDLIQDYESLVSLHDSLPLSADNLRQLVLYRIFDHLRRQNTQRQETLRQCREAVHEMRDLLGLEVLIPKFQAILEDVESEIRTTEKAVEFRGLTHPDQGHTRLKKHYIRGQVTPAKFGLNSRRQQENDADEIANERKEVDLIKLKQESLLWSTPDAQFSLADFKDRLYREQLGEMWT